MASLPFFALAAVCAITWLATPLKRGASYVRSGLSEQGGTTTRKRGTGAANVPSAALLAEPTHNASPLGFAQGSPHGDISSLLDGGSVSSPCAKPNGGHPC